MTPKFYVIPPCQKGCRSIKVWKVFCWFAVNKEGREYMRHLFLGTIINFFPSLLKKELLIFRWRGRRRGRRFRRKRIRLTASGFKSRNPTRIGIHELFSVKLKFNQRLSSLPQSVGKDLLVSFYCRCHEDTHEEVVTPYNGRDCNDH